MSGNKKHINPNLSKCRFNDDSKTIDIEQLASGVALGERIAIAEAITLVESSLEKDKALSQKLLDLLQAKKPKSAHRVVVTGSPGAGKSTFINAIVQEMTSNGKSVAVLATDPSSSISKGSILGDKTRMSEIGTDAKVFIRPTPSGNYLGGVSKSTLESMLICDAAQFDFILLETVGVGQSEYESYKLSDLFILLINPGAGDEIQGIKRGIMEMADIICINKDDGDNQKLAELTKQKYANALQLLTSPRSNWKASIHKISSLQSGGIKALWKEIDNYFLTREKSGDLKNERLKNKISILEEKAKNIILDKFLEKEGIYKLLSKTRNEITSGNTDMVKALKHLQEELDKLLR